jgi:predicted metal-dependent hydrolase
MSGTPIEVRPLRFDVDARAPRDWHGGRRSVTRFFDSLSIFFPAGERFFIQAVREHAKYVEDERLLADVRAFCGQEGAHSREHERYNDRVRSLGYPVDRLERSVKRSLARAARRAPKRVPLAITCALEHFTALMGHLLLADERVLADAHPEMAALWRWHAAEENEHKAVAYDVYLAAGGTYSERVWVMVIVTLMFWAKVLKHQVLMTRVDGTWLSPREWGALARWLFVSPGAMTRLIPLYLQYYRPGFHPNDIDSSGVLDAWRREQHTAG